LVELEEAVAEEIAERSALSCSRSGLAMEMAMDARGDIMDEGVTTSWSLRSGVAQWAATQCTYK
jgi:hypothetical protein